MEEKKRKRKPNKEEEEQRRVRGWGKAVVATERKKE